jgi:MFS transporter, DHA1 family, solute carrier family 18 (vesicular amine transporter), member 1/2
LKLLTPNYVHVRIKYAPVRSKLIMFERYRESKTGVLIVSCLAVFTDMVIYGVIMPIIKEIIEKYPGFSDKDVIIAQGALPAVYAAGLLIFTPIFGSLSDIYKTRKVPMLLGQIILAASTLMFAFAHNFSICLVARFLQGIAGAATWVVGMAMLADVFSGPDLGFYMGIVFSCHNLGFFLGPLIGGFLHDSFGMQSPFYICTALAMLDFFGRLWIKEPKKSDDISPQSDHPVLQKSSGLSMIQLAGKIEVILLNIVITIKAASFSSLESMLEIHLHKHFNYSPSQTSLVFLAFILPNILAVTIVGWISGRIRRYLIMTVGLILHPFAAPLITSTSNVNLIIIGGVIFGITLSIAGSPVSPELAEIVKSYGGASYARIYGILNISYSFGILIGPSIFGYIAKKTDLFVAMLGLTSCTLLYSPFFYLKMKNLYEKRILRIENLTKFQEK